MPEAASFDSLSVIALIRMIGKFIKQTAREFRTLTAVVMPSRFTARFYRA